MSSVIKIGELRTVLPPLGTNSIMAQNHAIPATGVPLIITKELLVLYQASIIRIVGDPIDPQIFDPSPLPLPATPPSSPPPAPDKPDTPPRNGTDDGCRAVTLLPTNVEVHQTVVPPPEPPPPEPQADIFPTTVRNILTEIDHGLENGQRYSHAPNAKRRAAWRVVARHCPEQSEAQCRGRINTWVANGVLINEEYDDPIRRDKCHGLRVTRGVGTLIPNMHV